MHHVIVDSSGDMFTYPALQIPVAEGSAASLTGLMKKVAAFVHGDDGFGNTYQRIVQVNPSLQICMKGETCKTMSCLERNLRALV